MECLSQYLIAVLCIFVGIVIFKRQKKNKGYPPGPIGIPFLGNILQVTRRPHEKFAQWAKIYGPIFRIKLAHLRVVVLTDPKIAKEILNDPAATGRMLDNPIFFEFTKGNYGVTNSEGHVWEQQRRFMLRTLKDFGFANKAGMEGLILDECKALLRYFDSFQGKPIPGVRTFNAPVLNSLWRIVSGERCPWEDTSKPPEILDLATHFFEVVQEVTGNGLLFMPVLINIAPELLGWNRYLKAINKMNAIFRKVIVEHEESFDGENIRDFIDAYLKEIKNETDENSSFYKENGYKNLQASIFDLLLAGSETTANTSSWAMLYLSQYPQIQERIYGEVERSCGSNPPSLDARAEMPFLEAFISEVLRLGPIITLGVPIRMLEDKWYNGYYFPKGTTIFVNLFAINRDPEIWGDPENFRPERFLSEDGKTFVKHESLFTFQAGKRICIGSNLARDTLFLFIASIVQRFKVLPEQEGKPADFEPDLGYFFVPKQFKMKMIPRKDVLIAL